MNTSLISRTGIATSAVTAATMMLAVAGAPSATAQRSESGSGTSAQSAAMDIGQVVAVRKAAAAQYRVDHALELYQAQLPSGRAR